MQWIGRKQVCPWVLNERLTVEALTITPTAIAPGATSASAPSTPSPTATPTAATTMGNTGTCCMITTLLRAHTNL